MAYHLIMTTEKELRELDAWIAEHVMGWHRCLSPIDATFPCFIEWSGCIIRHDSALEAYLFQPTTNPAAAMEVLKKCAEKISGRYIRIFQSSINKEWCVIRGYDIESKEYGQAKTLEAAICLFAKLIFER